MPRAFEAKPNNPAVAQLLKLHADLGGRILENKREGERLASDMRAVEAVIRMFDPGFDVRRIAVRRRQARNTMFKRGTMFREAMTVLRTAEGDLTTREIATRMLAAHGVAEPPLKQLRDTTASLRSSLENNAGKLVERAGEGMPMRWRPIT